MMEVKQSKTLNTNPKTKHQVAPTDKTATTKRKAEGARFATYKLDQTERIRKHEER